MRTPLVCVLLAVYALGAARAEDTVTAADTTERGRSLDRILDMVLLPEGREIEGERTLVFLLDPTSSLQSADLPPKLEAALERHAGRLGATRLGVARVGARGKTSLAGVEEADRVVAAAAEVVGEPTAAFQNVYADVRRLAGELKRRGGRRDLVLVTLENGDAEDDLEGTAAALRQAGVRLFVVARQAFLSDTYWVGRTSNAPARLDLAGPESAFVELPWGFLFQHGRPNESVASGFPVYGLSRLAEATGGRVFLFYPPSKSEHRCVHYGSCPFCDGDHVVADEAYRSHRLKALAPLLGSRREVMAEAARDPYYRAVLRAWEQMARKGIVTGHPSVKRGAGGLQARRPRTGRTTDIGSSIAFSSQAARAARLLGPLEDILRELEGAIEKAEGGGRPRYRAMAETTAVLLHVTRVNLHLFIAFCREVGPVFAGKRPEEFVLPEIPFYSGGERFVGIGWTSLSLCHGAKRYEEIYLPGGAAVRGEIEALDTVLAPFLARYAHTPFAALVRRSGLARFTLTVRGRYVPPPKREIPGSDTEETTTAPERPQRGGPSTGSGGGPTTGGE